MKQMISILGCGWLGLPLGVHLHSCGYAVKGSTTQEEKQTTLMSAGIQPYVLRLTPEPKGDIQSFLDTDILIVNVPPGKGDGQPNYYLRAMKALISEIEKSRVNKVLFISTTSVYPQHNTTVIEEDAIHIKSRFSDTIWLDVEELFTQHKQFTSTVLRFSGLIGGNYQPGRHACGKELAGAESPTNMIHRKDCLQIIEQIISKNVFGEVFNASADLHPTRRQLYNQSCKVLDVEPPIFNNEPSPYRIVNSDKLKKALNYRFSFPDPLDALND